MDYTLRVNCFEPLGHHVHLRFAELTIESVQLTIGVSDTYVVQIDECDLTNTRARE